MKTRTSYNSVIFFLFFLNFLDSTICNASGGFTENKGQWDSRILFRSQLDGGALFLEKTCLTFNFYDKNKFRALHHGGARSIENVDIRGHAYKVYFIKCSNATQIISEQKGQDYENFYLGNDEKMWQTGVSNYKKVWFKNIYDGIDYEIEKQPAGFKYNFYIGKNGDPSNIQMLYEGVNDLHLNNNVLTYKLNVTDAIEQKPYAYQLINGRKITVICNYILKNEKLSFEFPKGYNHDYELIIDPVLVFAAQSGSSADNFGMTSTWDAAGNLYGGGTVFNVGYPTTTGAYSTVFNNNQGSGMTDIAITKFNAVGNTLLYSTYLGGSQTEVVTSLIVDHSNNLCLLGTTSSTNFPMSSASYDNSFNGGVALSFLYNGTTFNNGTDIIICKFNAAGSALLGSTFLGGSGNDGVNHVNHLTPLSSTLFEYVQDSLQFNYGDQYRGEIQIDKSNNIYITSSTRSSNFPTVSAFDNSLGGKQDAIVAKLNTGLSTLLYSTYLGGSSNECGNSLIVDNNNDVIVTGGTCSNDFPTTSGSHKQTYGGGKADGFITKLSTAGFGIVNSSFIGTTNYDQGYFVQSDQNNNFYVYGQSLGNMPVIKATNATAVFNVPGTHQFIIKFNNSLSSALMATTFGSNTNSVDISPSAFGVDFCGNIYISGWGGDVIIGQPMSSSMPLLFPTQSTTDGFDFYMMELSADASTLVYGSYFGGALSTEHVDGGTSRIDKAGVFYQAACAGCGGNDDFPLTSGSWPNTPSNPNHSGNCNLGVIKLSCQTNLTSSNIFASTNSGCAPLTVTLNNVSMNYSSYNWSLPSNISNSTTSSPVLTFTSVGVYTVSLVTFNPSSCNGKDSSFTIINVSTPPSINVSSSNSNICVGETVTLTAGGANSYSWSTGANSSQIVITPATSNTYIATGTNPQGCSANFMYAQSVSLCTNVQDQEMTNVINLFPNPTRESVLVTTLIPITKISIFDETGKMLMSKEYTPTKKLELDLRSFAGGMYVLRCRTAENHESTTKMIKSE